MGPIEQRILRRHSEIYFNRCSLGPYRLANRIVMAPLTRSRASQDGGSDFLNGGILRAACLRRANHR